MRRGETIFALSSAPGRAAIAIVRVSGPDARDALQALTGAMPKPRMAAVRGLRFAGRDLDRALVLWFPGPRTATGEDVAEFHLHGGRAVIESVLSALSAIPGCRLAEPGEFSRRAFHNGLMDLTQAEGLADLIHADTEAQAAQALRQMDGALGRMYEDWRSRIMRGLAMTEAVIDFPDEDVPDSAAMAVAPDLRAVSADIGQHLNDGHRGEIVRDGLMAVILGAPNAGKSSLLNALAQRDVAIVSDLAGTTRDVLEVQLNLGGFAVTLVDTAGLRETSERIESEGIRRALARSATAHVRVAVFDPLEGAPSPLVLDQLRQGDVLVWNKSDLARAYTVLDFETVSVSAKTGEGLDRLVAVLGQRAVAMAGGTGSAVITRRRHREALAEAKGSLDQGLEVLGFGLDRAAEDFRLAARAIGRIMGRVGVEDVLDVVFAEFCIGK